MTQKSDGMNYAPKATKTTPVVKPGEFKFAAAHLDHGHIYGQCNGLVDAGGTLTHVFDPDPAKVAAFKEKFPQAEVVDSIDRLLDDPQIQLIAAAAIPGKRGPLGCRVMQAGKDYFTDKCPFTTLEQLDTARETAARTARKYMVYYSERLHVEACGYVDGLIQDGAIGRIVHMSICGPHRLSKPSRNDWFFQKSQYGGILTDICSHQFDQFLHYARASDGEILHARVENFANPDKPEFEDFGEAIIRLDSGISCHSRVDWFTPDGMRGWGDGRSVFVGTEGTIEVRKYFDFGRADEGDLILLANNDGEQVLNVGGQVGFPFFGQFILDCLNRTENAMTQSHAFKAAELSLKAQQIADQQRGPR